MSIGLSVVSGNAGVTGVVGLVAGHTLVDGCGASLACTSNKQVIDITLGADLERRNCTICAECAVGEVGGAGHAGLGRAEVESRGTGIASGCWGSIAAGDTVGHE